MTNMSTSSKALANNLIDVIAGYIDTFGTQAGIYVLIMALAIPVAIFGQKIRHITALWRVIL